MNQHPPAPWVVKTTIIGPESSIKVIGPKAGDLSDQSIVCMVPQTSEEQVKNTNLVIAAPDLLSALQAILATYQGEMLHPEIKAQAYAAIAKAGATA